MANPIEEDPDFAAFQEKEGHIESLLNRTLDTLEEERPTPRDHMRAAAIYRREREDELLDVKQRLDDLNLAAAQGIARKDGLAEAVRLQETIDQINRDLAALDEAEHIPDQP